MTQDICLTAANSEALPHTLNRNHPQKYQTSRLRNGRQSFNIKSKKVPYQLQKKKSSQKTMIGQQAVVFAYSDQDLQFAWQR